MGRGEKRQRTSQAPAETATAPRGGRRLTLVAAGVLVLGASALALWLSLRPPAGRPNVLLITIDTLRADHLGCYGARNAATPVLDALAARGVRFPTAVVHVPLTLPSHTSILTGLNPLRHGVRDNTRFVVPEGTRTAADWFHDAGYATAAFISGFPLVRHFGLAHGFDTYDDHLGVGSDTRLGAYVERPADQTTKSVLDWLDAHAQPERPFFLWVHYFDPHAPYNPPEPYAQRFAGRPYDGEIAFVDSRIGAVLRLLDEKQLASRTLVLVTADHGESLGEHGEQTHGFFIYDATLRVPFILAGPGVPAGRTPTAVARGIDIVPTLLDLAGVPAHPELDGRSLRKAFRGGDVADAPAYVESLYPLDLGFAPLHGWRTARWKYVQAPRPELYDLGADPGEAIDRTREQVGLAATLRGDLEAALRTTPPDASAKLTPESQERLRALGYLSAPVLAPDAASGPRDPKDVVGLVTRLEKNMGIVRQNPRAAADDLAAILREEPRMMPARRYRATALLQLGDYAGAVKELRALEQGGYASVTDAVTLGECLNLAGRRSEAMEVLERAAAKDPRAPEPLLGMAHVYERQDKKDDAVRMYEKILALEPGHVEAVRGLADVAEARADHAAAERGYRQILAGDARDGQAALQLARLLVRAERRGEATKLLEALVAREPANVAALHALGGVLAQDGHPEAAIQYFERAVDAGDRSAASYNALGASRLDASDAEGALKAFRQSLAVDPRQPKVAQLVSRLSKNP